MFDYDPSEYVTIPKGWQCKRLIDCTEDGVISYGIVQPGQQDEEGIPVIRVNNVNNGQLDISDILKVSPEIEQKYNRTRLKGGEVLLTLVGSTGQSLVVPKEFSGWNVARAIAVIRVKEEVGADWVNICLQSKETIHFLDVRANTTVQKTLNLKDVRDIPILIPPKRVKDSIKDTALSLSSKIELNRQTNATLEHIAQAIFKSWFVDFEPTRAKVIIKQKGGDEETQAVAAQAILCGVITLADLDALSNESSSLKLALRNLIYIKLVVQNSDKQNHNWLPEQLISTAKLFPNQLVDSELGEIPKGWVTKPVNSEIDILNGFAFKSKDYVDKGIFVLRTKNFNNNIVERLNDDVFLPEDFLGSHKKYLCKSYDYHMVMVGASIGSRGLIYQHHLPALRNQNMWCFRKKESSFITQSFVKLMLDLVVEKSVGLASGSAREFFRKGDFGNQNICIGNSTIQFRFSEIISPLFQKQSLLDFENSSISELRNTLLPKLLSGELSVSTEQLDELQNDHVSA